MPRKKTATQSDESSDLIAAGWINTGLKAPVDISPALAEPEWVGGFRNWVTLAFNHVRDYQEKPSFAEYARFERQQAIRFALKGLHDHIMAAWKRRNEAGIYICVESPDPLPAGVIDRKVREAYIEAHEMFLEIERRNREDPGKFRLPIGPLGRINDLLAVVTPAIEMKAVNRNEARDQFAYEQRMAGIENKKIMQAINNTKGWSHVGTPQAINGIVTRYCIRHKISKPSHKTANIKRD